MNIWQIQQELLSIFNELEENGGELTEELEQQLAISQEDFRSKVENYTNVIKSVKEDIAAIDQESKRLAELKKSKTAMVDRLSKVIIDAVDKFGDTTKNGGKFFDYGTGKVSIRNTQKVELDENKIDAIADEFSKAVAYEAMLGNASNREGFTYEEIIQRCKEHKDTNLDIIVDDPYDVTPNDIMATEVEVKFIKPLCELMSEEDGYNLIKNIASFTNNFCFDPKVNKTRIKSIIENTEENAISIAKIVPNKILTIK